MKYTRILLVVMIIGIASLASYRAYLYFGKGVLSVTAKPNDARIVVDKQSYSTKEATKITLTPGSHRVAIALDGFNTIEQTITMGWQDDQSINYQLTPKPFKEIFANLLPDADFSNYTAEQTKFFLNNTWAAGYLIGKDEADISLVVMQRINGAWRLIIQDYEVPENAKDTLPPDVYNYIKDFQQ